MKSHGLALDHVWAAVIGVTLSLGLSGSYAYLAVRDTQVGFDERADKAFRLVQGQLDRDMADLASAGRYFAKPDQLKDNVFSAFSRVTGHKIDGRTFGFVPIVRDADRVGFESWIRRNNESTHKNFAISAFKFPDVVPAPAASIYAPLTYFTGDMPRRYSGNDFRLTPNMGLLIDNAVARKGIAVSAMRDRLVASNVNEPGFNAMRHVAPGEYLDTPGGMPIHGYLLLEQYYFRTYLEKAIDGFGPNAAQFCVQGDHYASPMQKADQAWFCYDVKKGLKLLPVGYADTLMAEMGQSQNATPRDAALNAAGTVWNVRILPHAGLRLDAMRIALWPLVAGLMATFAVSTLLYYRRGQFARIEAIVRERTAELAERTREAEAAARAKSEFLAVMSHEIRTPLNGVLGMIALMKETNDNNERDEYIEIMEKSGASLLTLINDILDLSRLGSGKEALLIEAFSLRELANGLVDMLKVQAMAKHLDLVVEFGADVPDRIRADERRLRQVLFNLVGNAIKFTPRGRVTVRATRLPDDAGRCLLQISVEDTGIGIPAGRLDAIFRPFEQVDSSTTRHFGGTGLGLAICRDIVKLWDGTLWVDSVVDEGSTFHFTLPCDLAD